MALPEVGTTVFAEHSIEITIRIIAQVITLLMSAFFSASEVALFSLNRMDLNKLESQRNPFFDRIQLMLKEPRSLIISILCGNELVNIASSANMAALLLLFFTEQETQWINLAIMVPLLLLIGEVTPKTLAITSPILFVSKMTAPYLPGWIVFIRPVRRVIRMVADVVTTWIAGHPPLKHNILHADEFLTLVEEGEEGGAIDQREKILIKNMLDASATDVMQIMTPYTRMDYLDADKPTAQLFEDFRAYKHPHMPVIRNKSNNIIGFLETEDVQRMLKLGTDLNTIKIDEILRPVHFVPPNKNVDEMFDYFKENKTWASIVLGEYGRVYGIVTIADVLGFVFEGVTKQYDEVGYTVIKGEPDIYQVAGDMNLIRFNELSGLDINLLENDAMITTMGGHVFYLFGRLPASGDTVEDDGVRFTVTEMDNLRIKSLEVMRFELRQNQEHESTSSLNEFKHKDDCQVRQTQNDQDGKDETEEVV